MRLNPKLFRKRPDNWDYNGVPYVRVDFEGLSITIAILTIAVFLGLLFVGISNSAGTTYKSDSHICDLLAGHSKHYLNEQSGTTSYCMIDNNKGDFKWSQVAINP